MKLIYVLIMAVALSGCQRDMNRNEIGDIDFVRVMGVEKQENYNVSLVIEQEGETVVKDGEGATVFEAYEKIAQSNYRPITMAHTKYFLIEAAAAEKDLRGCIDFITRDEKIKTDAAVYIIRESPKIFLEKNSKIAENLDNLSRKPMFYSTKQSNTLTDLYNPKTDALLPVLVSEKEEITAKGYCLVQNMTVKIYTDEQQAVGLNFLADRVRFGGVFTSEGGMMIYNSKTKIKNNRAEIFFASNIKEITGDGNLQNINYISRLTALQNDYVKVRAEKAAAVLRENKIIFKKTDWEKTEVSVQSKITGTFDIE